MDESELPKRIRKEDTGAGKAGLGAEAFSA